MEYYISVEGITNFIMALIAFFLVIIMQFDPKTKKIKSIIFIKLTFLNVSGFYLFEGLGSTFIIPLYAHISGILSFDIAFFTILSVNYIRRESFYSKGLILVFGLGLLLFYLATQPDSVQVIYYQGRPRIHWTGLFGLISNILTYISLGYLFYWALKTWLNAPILIKKEASIFFLGILIATIISMCSYLVYLIFLTLLFLEISNFLTIIGISITTLAIIREPKLLYILPFTVYRMIVKDEKGNPLYDHDWSESNISESIFTGFLNAVQLMSEDVMNIGGLLDINLQKGILILHKSEHITVGLVSSKSSKLLRDIIVKFSNEFEEKFERLLRKKSINLKEYESAYELIEKYFSNFPYRIVKSRKHPLLISSRPLKLPVAIENKLKHIFQEIDEYNFIKKELAKSPACLSSEFLELYDDLKLELEQLPDKKPKYLESSKENSKNNIS